MKSKIQRFGIEFEVRMRDLLRTATPTSLKSYQLFKRSQQEGLPRMDYNSFCGILAAFYQTSFQGRRPSFLEKNLNGKISDYYYDEFLLDFSNAYLEYRQVNQLKSWCREQVQYFNEIPPELKKNVLIERVVDHLLQMAQLNKSILLEWRDFLASWQVISSREFGDKHHALFSTLREIRITSAWNFTKDATDEKGALRREALTLTNTEILWLKELDEKISLGENVPLYPHSKGPPNSELKKLNHLILSYNSAGASELPAYKIQIKTILENTRKYFAA